MDQTPSQPERVLFLCTGNYYRSRFAEIVFNHLSSAEGLGHSADSAGLAERCWKRNPGPMSPHTLQALAQRRLDPGPLRPPRDAEEADFSSFTKIIAMKESEHRPMMRARFAGWETAIDYWAFDDVQDQPPELILPQIEQRVRDLLASLAPRRQRC